MKYTFKLNGKSTSVDAPGDMPLLWVLRDTLDMKGTKFGCGIGFCGACTVHLNGTAVRSCQTPVSTAANKDVTSIEGLSADGTHPVQRAWEEIVATVDQRRGVVHVVARADADVIRWLRVRFGTRLTVGAPHDDGRVNVDIGFPETHDDPARELCSFAGGVEVLSPPDVRARVADIGRALIELHA